MADMLSRARFDDEDGMVSENEDVGVDFFDAAHLATERGALQRLTNSTRAITTGSGSKSEGS
jgi:hypothetical protein